MEIKPLYLVDKDSNLEDFYAYVTLGDDIKPIIEYNYKSDDGEVVYTHGDSYVIREFPSGKLEIRHLEHKDSYSGLNGKNIYINTGNHECCGELTWNVSDEELEDIRKRGDGLENLEFVLNESSLKEIYTVTISGRAISFLEMNVEPDFLAEALCKFQILPRTFKRQTIEKSGKARLDQFKYFPYHKGAELFMRDTVNLSIYNDFVLVSKPTGVVEYKEIDPLDIPESYVKSSQ